MQGKIKEARFLAKGSECAIISVFLNSANAFSLRYL